MSTLAVETSQFIRPRPAKDTKSVTMLFNTGWDGASYLDEHGRPTRRTPVTNPYSYDGFVLWVNADESIQASDTVYTDRMWQWDPAKYDRLHQQHFGDTAQLRWNEHPPGGIEAFLRDYRERPDLVLVRVMQYCNLASGYPVWRMDYKL